MTRGQRRVHQLAWWVLLPLLLAMLTWALVERWRYPDQAVPGVRVPAHAEGTRR